MISKSPPRAMGHPVGANPHSISMQVSYVFTVHECAALQVPHTYKKTCNQAPLQESRHYQFYVGNVAVIKRQEDVALIRHMIEDCHEMLQIKPKRSLPVIDHTRDGANSMEIKYDPAVIHRSKFELSLHAGNWHPDQGP